MTNDKITAKEYHEYLRTGKLPDRVAHTDAELEPDFGNAPNGKKKTPRFDSQVHITFHHVRKRKIDPDNLSIKALLDGIRQSGLLTDDTAKEIKSITHTQEKGKKEKTIITIYRAEAT